MSTLAPPPPASPTGAPPVDAACPLCGAPLHPSQEWCLSCGAAARTRLAAPTSWRTPIVAIAVTAALALGVLAAALISLSGGPGPARTAAPITETVPSATTTPIVPGVAGSIPTATSPTGVTGLGGTVAPGGAAGATTPGGPGTPTTISPSGGSGGAAATTPTGTPTATTTTGGGASHYSPAAEEALRKAGFLPRTKK